MLYYFIFNNIIDYQLDNFWALARVYVYFFCAIISQLKWEKARREWAVLLLFVLLTLLYMQKCNSEAKDALVLFRFSFYNRFSWSALVLLWKSQANRTFLSIAIKCNSTWFSDCIPSSDATLFPNRHSLILTCRWQEFLKDRTCLSWIHGNLFWFIHFTLGFEIYFVVAL